MPAAFDRFSIQEAKKNFFHNIVKYFAISPSSNSTPGEENLEEIAAQEQKHFSYEALAKATNNFHHDRKLGESGFGPVYKGKLDDGREIAVNKLSRSSRQGNNEFQNEARLLMRIQHRNFVNMLGYCASGEEKLLVYQYVKNESLDKLLFNILLESSHHCWKSGVCTKIWTLKVKIVRSAFLSCKDSVMP